MALARRKRPRRRQRPRLNRLETLESRRLLATYFVTTNADTIGGTCVADNGPSSINCSIRDAIIAAESTPEGDTIQIPPDNYLINSTNGSFDLDQSRDTAFVGTGQSPTEVVIDGVGESRGFDLFGSDPANPFDVTFENLTIQNGIGRDGSGGGGINANEAVNLTLTNVIVQNSVAAENVFNPGAFSSGGGIQASGDVVITDSVIRGNSATIDGGGIDYGAFDSTKSLVVTDSTFEANSATSVGGGIFAAGGDVVLDNVVFNANDGPDSGGGVYASGTNLTVSNSQFSGNTAPAVDSGGGGLYILGGSFVVADTDFDNNSAVDGAGGLEIVNADGTVAGGIFDQNQVTGVGNAFDQGGGGIVVLRTGNPSPTQDPVLIDGVKVTNNTAPAAGGIALVNANVTITDSLIQNNNATSQFIGAGGIGAVNETGTSVLTIRESQILGNSTAAEAGGIGAVDVSLDIFDTTIDGNIGDGGRAGGIGLIGNTRLPVLTIERSTISNNLADTDGGGIAVDSAALQLTNVTVTENTAFGVGGGIAYNNSDNSIASSISFSTIADSSGLTTGDNLASQGTAPITITSSIFAIGNCAVAPGSVVSGGFNIDDGTSCGLADATDQNNTDPLLGPLQDNGGLVLTRGLGNGSPAIDAAGGSVPAVDARGFPRPIDGDGDTNAVADIGAVEFGSSLPLALEVDENSDVVDGDFTPGNLSLREAIERANANPGLDTITFGGPFADATPDTIVLGGTELTITDSLIITGPGAPLLSISGNDASRIFFVNGASNDTTLSGLTMTQGADIGFVGTGGAILNNATLTIVDSVITASTANGFGEGTGGGIFNTTTLTILRSTISGNSTNDFGGGIFNSGTLRVSGSNIVGNVADDDGGGIDNRDDALITDSTISGNSAVYGGGIAVGSGRLTLVGSTVANNTGDAQGGGIFADDGITEVINSTVSGNATGGGGGGIRGQYNVFSGTDPTITVIQSSIIGNRADADGNASGVGGGIGLDADVRSPQLFNSIVAGNVTGIAANDQPNDIGGGQVDGISANNLIGDPASSSNVSEGVNGNLVGNGAGDSLALAEIVDPTLADNGGPTMTHAIVSGSRAINAGENSFATTGGDDGTPGTGDNNEVILANDQRGDTFPRVLNSVVDIGAFESMLSPPPVTSPPDLDSGSDTGVSDTDNITFVTTPRLSGTTDPGATVEIFDRVLPTRRLTYDSAVDFFPAWDPAGETIVFVTTRPPAGASVSNIGQVQSDATGEGLSLIGPNSPFGFGHSPSWVGSTGVVAFAVQTGLHEYATYNQRNAPTSTKVRELFIDGGGGGGNIVISRDGSTALWRFSTAGGGGLVSVRTAPVASLSGQSANTHGTLLQTFNSPGSNQIIVDSHGFALSPDGSQYVIAEPQNIVGSTFSGFDLFLRSTADGSLIQRLTTSGQNFGSFNGQPDFSPDGSKIAFVRADADQGVDDIYEINVDGTGLRAITHSGRRITERMPSYSNDGNRLAFATPATDQAISPLFNEVNNWNVYVIEGINDVQPPGALLGTTVADANGVWSLGVGVLSEGDHVLTARASFPAGGGGGPIVIGDTIGPVSAPLHLTIDTTAPEFPTTPNLVDASDTGDPNDDVTNDNTPTFDGAALAGAKVELFDNGTPIGSTIAATPLYDANDLLVVDQDAQGTGAVIAVDRMTGVQTLVSSGQNFVSPNELAFDSDGNLYVTDSGAQAVIQIDPFTGVQTVLSSGGSLQNPVDIVVESTGNLLVTDAVTAAVIRIDPASGAQTTLTSGGNISATGLRGIALDPSGNVLITDSVADLLIRVDPNTGVQSVVSSGDNFFDPRGVTVAPTGEIFVADRSAFAGLQGGIIQIDPFTGIQTVVSSGGSFQDPFDVIVDGVGDFLVADFTADTLFHVDPLAQNTVSTGGSFVTPVSVDAAVLPLGNWSLTSIPLSRGNHDITALATDVAGNVSGRTVVKNLEFNIDGVLPSREADVEFSTNSGNAESSIFSVQDGTLNQMTTGFDGNAVYGLPNAPSPTGGGIDPSQGVIQEINIDAVNVQGASGASFQVFDGVNRYSASLTPTGVRIIAAGGDVDVPVNFAESRTLRLESPGNSDQVRLFVDGQLVRTTTAAPFNLNGFLLGDSLSTPGDAANVNYDFYRVAQQAPATPLPITIEIPRLVVQDVFVEESTNSVDIFVSIDTDIGTPFSIDYMTVDDSAFDGDDYVGDFGTLNFNGFADDIQVITIPIIDDDIVENDEQFFVTFDSFSPGTISLDTTAVGTVSIFDDDEAFLSINGDVTFEDDGSLFLSVTLSGDTDEPFTVDVSTFDIDAVEGDDYTGFFDQLFFDGFDGETQEFEVELDLDAIVELDEDFGFVVDGIDAGTRDIKFDNFADFVSFNSIGQFTPPGGINVNDVALFTPGVNKTIAYVGDDAGFTILDVSDPSAVVQLGSFPTNDAVVAIETIDVTFFSDTVFAVAGTDGLQIFDVVDPANIMRIGAVAQAGQRALSLDRVGDTVYIGEANALNEGKLRIIDASNPLDITQLSETDLAAGEEVLDIVTEGATAYLATNEGGLQIFDVSDPTSPTLLGALAAREAISIARDGDRVYLGTPTGLSVIDVSNPNTPTEVGFFFTNVPVTSVDEDGPIVTIGDAGGTFRILNAEFGPNVFQLGFIDFPGALGGFDSEGLFSYLSNGTGGLQIVQADLGGNGFGTILNDDSATLSINNVATDEDNGQLTFTVTLSADVDTSLSVDFDTLDLPNEAEAGTDYVGQSGTLDFDGDIGETRQITITLSPDTDLEPDESFAVDLSFVDANGRDVTINPPGRGIGTILNDDFPPISVNDDMITILEDMTEVIPVLGNDLPAGGLTVTGIVQGALGIASITPGGGSVTYVPNQDVFGTDIFTYTATDGFGQSESALVTVTISPVNDDPIAEDDVINATDRNQLTIPVGDLLANDSPGPNETDNFDIVDVDSSSTNGGTIDFTPGGPIVYTPPVGFNGSSDTFQYTISDDGTPVLSDSATVTINFPPSPATLQGHIYCDADGNGVEDLDEQVVGTLVFLDQNGNRQLDVGERSTFTDSNGDYLFDNVTDPTLTVVAAVPDGCLSVPSNLGIARSQVGLRSLARALRPFDIDGDDDKDLIVVGDLVNDLATVLRNDNGIFSISTEIPLGDRPQSIDVWEQGDSSIVAVAGIGTPENGGSVYVLGDDSVLQVEAGNGPVDLAIDDFDQNGIPDIVVAALRSSDVQLLMNGGPAVPIGSARLVRAVETGDVNDDGNPDIVLGGFSYPDDDASQLAVRLGDGAGGFAAPLTTNPIRKLVDLGVGPLDQFDNGFGNLVWSLSETGSLALYDVSGSSLQLINATDVTPGATSFDTGDFNRDGLTDVAVASLGNQLIELYIGDGEGSFALVNTIENVSSPSDIIVSDLDGDGRDDLAVTNLYTDANLGQLGDPDYELPSSVTVLLVDVAESGLVINGTTVGEVNFAFQNADPDIIFDVTGEGEVTALDALRVINALEPSTAEGEPIGRAATDINGDGRTSAVDALMVINYLARQQASGLVATIDLLSDEDDEEERYAAVDVVFGELV